MSIIIDMAATDPAVSAELARFALDWGKAFVVLSFVAALVGLVLAAIAAVKAPKDGANVVADSAAAAAFLAALKGVLEALVKLPGWVAIFLAGCALLWFAGHPS
jgi:hypothetical protein